MKNIFGLFVASSLLTVSGYASELEDVKQDESKFYVAVKALVTLGDNVDEGESRLEGSTGKGIGIDLGYRISHGFVVEIDATYATNTVTEVLANGDSEDFSGDYITSSLDVAYNYKLLPELNVFAKVGYEVEYEKIDTIADSYASTTGFIYAAGMEYEVAESMAVLAEYEVTTIDGPRGNSIFLGLVYDF